MDIAAARLIYFSPTQTTRRILEGIARGIQAVIVEQVDLTPPDAMAQGGAETHDKLAVIGAPVYGGRLPAEAVSRLRRLRGNGTPAVIVVVYGNRGYEDALLELRDLALGAGFVPVAAGAFIGEHSYSTDATPIAVGRPDAEDLREAEEFGRMVRKKTRGMRPVNGIPPLQVPGTFPYRERVGLANIAPVTHEADCALCARCAAVCPTAAITAEDAASTDPGICIRCCACVKACPTGARTMADPRIREMAERLSANCRERKEPETYL